MTFVTDAFEDLSHSLRVLLEADARANREGLMYVDRAEAVGNIESALASVLNSFHSLHDAVQKTGHGGLIDWYETPELAMVLVLRNARHHNHARKVRTMYSYYVEEAEKIGNLEMYILVDFPAGEDGADTFDVYLSWADLRSLLAMSKRETRIRPEVTESIHAYLATHKYRQYAEYYELYEDRVFVNVVPLLVNAAAKVIPLIKPLVTPRSTESKVYLSLFEDMVPADTHNHDVNCGPIAIPP